MKDLSHVVPARYEARFAPVHHTPQGFGDRFAFRLVKFMRVFADRFFAGRYGNHDYSGDLL